MKIFKKGDLLIITIIILISIVSILYLSLSNEESEDKMVVLKVSGEVIKKIHINSRTKEKYEFQFGENIGYLEVSDGQIRMLKMSKEICPQQICSETGWIDKNYETIVCLPNKITVDIEKDESTDIDEISF